MLLPAIAVLAVFILWPFIQGVVRAFFDYNGGNIDEFNGIDNFVALLTKDPLFWPALKNGLLLTGVAMLQGVVIPFTAAWLIHHFRHERAKYVARILVMVPVVVPGVVGLLIWKQFLGTDGALNLALAAIGLGDLQQNWLGDPKWVLVGLMLVGLPWLNGVNTLLYLAALGNVPKELYEAGSLDGAGRWRILRTIELPFVSAQTKIILTISLIAGLQAYENVYILTRGGPADSSVVPGLLLFRNAFSYGQLGYANAIGIVVALVILLIVGIFTVTTRLVRRDDQ